MAGMARSPPFCAAWRTTARCSWPRCTRVSRSTGKILILASREEGGPGQGADALQAQSASQRVDEWLKAQPRRALAEGGGASWHQRGVACGSPACSCLAVGWRRAEGSPWHLVVTRSGFPETIKYTLSNAPAETSLERLVQMQRQRFWIERSFEDGKSESGMAGLPGARLACLAPHMALVMMAMLFMLEEKLLHNRATHC